MRKPGIKEAEKMGTDLTLMNFRTQDSNPAYVTPRSALYSASHCDRTRVLFSLPALFS